MLYVIIIRNIDYFYYFQKLEDLIFNLSKNGFI